MKIAYIPEDAPFNEDQRAWLSGFLAGLHSRLAMNLAAPPPVATADLAAPRPPLRTLRKIAIPLIAANLLAGGLLAFSFAMLEVSDSLILAQKQQDFPITKAIYELYQLLGEGRFVASALGDWAMAFLAVTTIGASLILVVGSAWWIFRK